MFTTMHGYKGSGQSTNSWVPSGWILKTSLSGLCLCKKVSPLTNDSSSPCCQYSSSNKDQQKLCLFKRYKKAGIQKREWYIIYTDIWEILRFQISKNKNKLRRRSNRLTMTYSPRVHLFKGHNFHRQRIHEELRQSMRATPSSDDAAAGGDAGLWGGILLKAFQHHLLTVLHGKQLEHI